MTIETLKTLIRHCWANPRLGVPTLIGPPRGGKTRLLRLLAEEEGRRTVWINPQCDAPEDIAGWPVRTGRQLNFTQPALIPPDFLDAMKKPGAKGLVIIDEMDKARDETTSALLTFLNPDERRLRWTYLPDNVGQAVAMNEPKRTLPEPLVERMLFLPYPLPGTSPFDDPALRPLLRAAGDTYRAQEVRFPERQVTIGALYMLNEWRRLRAFWGDEAEGLRTLVVRGLFPGAAAAAILGRLDASEAPWLDPVAWAERVSAAEAASGWVYAWRAANTPEQIDAFCAAMKARQGDDPTGEWSRIYEAMSYCPEALEGINRGATDEQAATGQQMLLKRLKEVAEAPEAGEGG